jgi:two-component system, sensor histidine kinase and response regulator
VEIEFRPEPLNIGEFFGSIVEEFQAIYSETHPVFYHNGSSETTMADPRLLRQIATNLISNAIKYSPPDNEVTVSLVRHEHDYILIVQDRGVGIPEDDRARLFSVFQRASNVGAVQGTGLGLAIVKQATDLHGGSVQLESTVGQGTTITVTIPTLQSS